MNRSKKKCTFRVTQASKSQYENLPVRYVCIDCLHTFKDEIYNPIIKCWECNGELVGIERNIGVVSEKQDN